jgi:hypothetical protein
MCNSIKISPSPQGHIRYPGPRMTGVSAFYKLSALIAELVARVSNDIYLLGGDMNLLTDAAEENADGVPRAL